MPSITATPITAQPNAEFTLSIVGVGTTFTADARPDDLWTLTGGTGASIDSHITVVDDTHCSFLVIPGTAAGRLTITYAKGPLSVLVVVGSGSPFFALQANTPELTTVVRGVTTIYAVGTGTTFLTHGTFTIAGSDNSATLGVTIVDDTHATIVVTPNTATGALTIANPAYNSALVLVFAFPSVDPFTKIYNAVWALLVGYAPFASTFKIGDRVDFADGTSSGNTAVNGSKTNPFKSNTAPADTPEAMLLEGPFRYQPFGNSKSTDFELTVFVCITIDRLALVTLNRATLITAVPLLRTGDTLGLPGLVRGWQMTDAKVTDEDGKLSRGSKRFVATAAIKVNGYINRSDLLFY